MTVVTDAPKDIDQVGYFYVNNVGFNVGSATVRTGQFGALGLMTSAINFDNLVIPAGKEVLSVTHPMYPNTNSGTFTNPYTIRIRAMNRPDAPLLYIDGFPSGTYTYADKAAFLAEGFTTAYVDWSINPAAIPQTGNTMPDISAVLQELVDTHGGITKLTLTFETITVDTSVYVFTSPVNGQLITVTFDDPVGRPVALPGTVDLANNGRKRAVLSNDGGKSATLSHNGRTTVEVS